MDAASTLQVIAQIAIAMTGFAGIIGALAGERLRTAHPEVWLPFWAMISSGFVVLFAALFPFLPIFFGASEDTVWAASSGLVALLTVTNLAVFMPRIWRAQRAGAFSRLWAISVPLDLCSVLTVGSQVLNALGLGLERSAGGFLLGLYTLLLISALNFVFLTYVLFRPRRLPPEAG